MSLVTSDRRSLDGAQLAATGRRAPDAAHRGVVARLGRLPRAQRADRVDGARRRESAARDWLLTRPSSRERLAGAFESVLVEAELSRGERSGGVSICHAEIEAAREEILRFAERVREAGRVSAAGVTLARRVLADTSGPLYVASTDDELSRQMRCAVEALACDATQARRARRSRPPRRAPRSRAPGRRVGAAEQRRGLAADRRREVLDLEAVGVDRLDLDPLDGRRRGAARSPACGSARDRRGTASPRRRRPRARRARAMPKPASKCASTSSGEAHRRGEADVDAVAAEHLLGADALGLAGEQPRSADAVAADVHQRAAVERRAQPHVRRIVDDDS